VLAFAPATASAAGLIAAYDKYVTGQGFQIGLVNVATGAAIAVPAGVNTADDELHPALSADGRSLVFTRMKLLPKLNGDIVPPTQRTLIWVDRQTGASQAFNGGAGGTGAVYTSMTSTSSTLAWGLVPEPPRFDTTTFDAEGFDKVARGASLPAPDAPPSWNDDIFASGITASDVPHAASLPGLFSEPIFFPGCQPCPASRAARYLSLSTHDPNTGAFTNGLARLSLFGQQGGVQATGANATTRVLTFGGPGEPAGHPVPRSGDGYVALDRTTGEDADIHSITYPGETQTTVAPTPITTTSPERMPAWSPDGLKLGFVRHSSGQRRLGLFDATPGIQTVVNTPVAIGAEAPSPQTRAFQNVYGGVSIANGPPAAAPTIICGTTCLSQLKTAATIQTVTLAPTVTSRTTIGIFVVRVRGKRKLLGRIAPRLRVVGRVPLGRARKGTNRFRWNGKVDGKRLKRGTYLLTYRSLKGKRITNTSGSVRFKIAKGGKVRQVRRERVRTPRR
jgi:hypothetical protein